MHLYFERNENVEDDLESYYSYDDGESGEESIEDLDEIPDEMEEDLINEADNRVDFAEELKEWALSGNIPLTQVSKLLLILRRNGHQELPKTAVTLLKTKHNFESVTLENNFGRTSQFVYFGIEKGLRMCLNPDLHPNRRVELLFHVDGAKMYRSSFHQFWPILCQIFHESGAYKPFSICVHMGVSKPDNMHVFFMAF